eukprot:365226-Chlamydomonas_euryale.AAC.19
MKRTAKTKLGKWGAKTGDGRNGRRVAVRCGVNRCGIVCAATSNVPEQAAPAPCACCPSGDQALA